MHSGIEKDVGKSLVHRRAALQIGL